MSTENLGRNILPELLSELTTEELEHSKIPWEETFGDDWDKLDEHRKILERIRIKELSLEEYQNRFLTSKKNMRESGVKPRFIEASKNDIQPDLWKKINPFFKGESLFIYGPVGCGKTHLLAAMIREHFEAHDYRYPNGYPKRIKVISVPELLLEIKGSFSNNGQDLVLAHFSSRYVDEVPLPPEIIIFDDVGSENVTEWVTEQLYLIINRRYEACKQSVFTSNLSLEELSKKFGDRISSRIAGMCSVVQIAGRDRRLK